MEDTSLDSDQLRKGRRYANSGQVGTITVSPGRIAATVYAPEDTYESVVQVDELSADDWRRFSEQVAARAGHIAALLDGEMPHDLVEAAADAGVTLLPGIGDLDPTCTCDAWELPCQHAAALCYQVAWLLDADPFILLLLRGQTRAQLLDHLQHHTPPSHPADAPSAGAHPADAHPSDALFSSANPADGESSADLFGARLSGGGGACPGRGGELAGAVAGVAVADVLTAEVADLPAPPELPGKVSVDDLPVSGIEPPVGLGADVLRLLVLDAARRARVLLSALLHGTPEPRRLDEWQDAVRLAADFPEHADALTQATGRELALGIQAWRYGGAPGLDVLEQTWTPDPADLNRARTELEAAELTVTAQHNHLTITADSTRPVITAGGDSPPVTTDSDRLDLTGQGEQLVGTPGTQLRLDREGRWHLYKLVDDTWTPAAPASADPLVALAIDW
ncbi:SWIM zinc finger family protein [Kribbella sp. NPDC026611]|uniref:SWIM zinc finger family protein n=1 Tax=Kribbella sp. NPDC026611 TaxID=3154911 RepID=UPI0033C3596D